MNNIIAIDIGINECAFVYKTSDHKDRITTGCFKPELKYWNGQESARFLFNFATFFNNVNQPYVVLTNIFHYKANINVIKAHERLHGWLHTEAYRVIYVADSAWYYAYIGKKIPVRKVKKLATLNFVNQFLTTNNDNIADAFMMLKYVTEKY